MTTFVSGYLGLLTTLATTDGTNITGAAVEMAVTNYHRQPVSFATPRNGVSKLATPYSFGFLGTGGQIVGRALYASATGTEMILQMPFPSGPRLMPGGGPCDALDIGGITLFVSAMAAFADGAAFSNILSETSGLPIGTCYDLADELNAPWASVISRDGTIPKAIPKGTLIMPCGAAMNVLGGRLLPIAPVVVAGA